MSAFKELMTPTAFALNIPSLSYSQDVEAPTHINKGWRRDSFKEPHYAIKSPVFFVPAGVSYSPVCHSTALKISFFTDSFGEGGFPNV